MPSSPFPLPPPPPFPPFPRRNAIVRAGFEVVEVSSPAELASASILVFPGVGCFGACVEFLDKGGFRGPLLAYIRSGRPFMGICLGMQTLFESSEETAGSGLGVIPGSVTRFPPSESYSVPHIGWNGVSVHQPAHPAVAALPAGGKVYFVHSYRAPVTPENASWVCTTTDYGGHRFISSVAKGNVFATQFHPEKSAGIGIDIFRAFLTFAAAQQPQLQGTVAPTLPEPAAGSATASSSSSSGPSYASVLDTAAHPPTRVCRRIVACLDVRTNDDGDLVVTKGDKYDVREKDDDAVGGAGGGGGAARGGVRNLGKPVELSARYYDEGADEIAFLNITAFREEPLDDLPMLAVLEGASERVFVPLTVSFVSLAHKRPTPLSPQHELLQRAAYTINVWGRGLGTLSLWLLAHNVVRD
jgi:glutamine amidotransferase/cyclase